MWFITCNTLSLKVSEDTIDEDLDINEDLDIDNIILEGDIRIPVDMMLEYYNFSGFPGGEQMLQKLKIMVSNKNTSRNINNTFQAEAAARYKNLYLWSDKTIPYKISSIIF